MSNSHTAARCRSARYLLPAATVPDCQTAKVCKVFSIKFHHGLRMAQAAQYITSLYFANSIISLANYDFVPLCVSITKNSKAWYI